MNKKTIFLSVLIAVICAIVYSFTLYVLDIDATIPNRVLFSLTGIIYLCYGAIYLKNRYLTYKYTKIINNQFELLVKIHKNKYKSYFEYNQDKTKAYSDLFKKGFTYLTDALTDEEIIKIMQLSSKQKEQFNKMINKINEMNEKEFITDYSL